VPGRYDAVLFDLDGTLLIADRALAGAAQAVAAAREAGARVGFLTNDPVTGVDAQAERLAAAGIAAAPGEIMTSLTALARLAAAELGPAPVLLLGSAALAAECAGLGLEQIDDPAQARAVLLGGAGHLTFTDLTAAVRAVLVHGAALYGANRDATYPAAGGPAPGCGALVAAVETSTGRIARCAGKPEPWLFDEARQLLGHGDYLVVGDRLDADVVGGVRAGMATALVLTGSTDRAELDAWDGPAPDHVLGSIGDAVALVAVAA
jgi:HAD superfamily hydrolase (TIGR01450 family)